ncbi:MAG: hypothetical protein CTY15_12615 [Methylocystis sp.]|nr:MAG: hypothetical protein CTY15_12615 [Methylocystis sp.]
MSAANASAPTTSLQEEMRAHEPSMEEILASIRRIIADDDSLPGARREREQRREAPAVELSAPVTQAAYPAPALEPVALTREEAPAPAMSWSEPAPVADIHQLRTSRAAPEPVAIVEIEEVEEIEEEYAAETDEATAFGETDEPLDFVPEEASAALVSPDAASSIASHFQALAASMVINDSGLLHKYAQEMLRPMLKQWLDDNLPVIVERLVRAEIERVARGGRR